MKINTTSAPDIELVTVAAGEFEMGPGPLQTSKGVEPNPAHRVHLDEFQIGRYPVTNEQYYAFVCDTGHRRPFTAESGFPADQAKHPVAGIRWSDAWLFCAWLAFKTGKPYHVPTEAEWEKAATWNPATGKKQPYPWGDSADSALCNVMASGFKATTPVGKFSPQGDSPYGCSDMTGNVDEWCNSELAGYPYLASDGREQVKAIGRRGTRGGDWNSALPTANRRNVPSDWWEHLWGFRVALGSGVQDAQREYATKVEDYIRDVKARRQAGIDGDPNNAQLYYDRGTWYLSLGDSGAARYEESIADLNAALRLATTPEFAKTLASPLSYVYYNRAMSAFNLKRYAEANADFTESLKLEAGDVYALIGRAISRANIGQRREAEEDLAAALRIVPKHPQTTAVQTHIAVNNGDHKETIRLCTEIIDRPMFHAPGMTEAHLWRGRAYEALGMTNEALSDYYHYILWEPDAPETAELKARLMGK